MKFLSNNKTNGVQATAPRCIELTLVLIINIFQIMPEFAGDL